ncbi:hypothetical protein Bhyg_11745 [Pseudolycoriella hygida]|uniref:Uncharacterized protein n=1 Tax=Pseudolycoriella hygida TaxID=35572 RepID=A0A9Q0MW41_9DIPT|nr:hypothetical protein Bhyg_11745 [Pseudolycoriella hygida]
MRYTSMYTCPTRFGDRNAMDEKKVSSSLRILPCWHVVSLKKQMSLESTMQNAKGLYEYFLLQRSS